MRIKATQIEKDSVFTQVRLNKSNKENTELLLGEIAQLYKPRTDLPIYLKQKLMPRLQDLDSDFQSRMMSSIQAAASAVASNKFDF